MSLTLSRDLGAGAASTSSQSLLEILGWVALVALLVVAVPLFVRMPVTLDVFFYDTCALCVLRGSALERDILFLTPPGMVWSLALVRAVLGESSEAIRLVDLAVFMAIVWLLLRWLRDSGLPPVTRVWAAVLLYSFYLSTSEWNHCQPDTWMLLPALAALHLRRRQVQALAEQDQPACSGAVLFLEGMCWAAGCLFKPFVVVPALLVWLASVCLARQYGKGWGRWLAWNAFVPLAGGLLVGAAWLGWLVASDSLSQYMNNLQQFRGVYYSRAPGLVSRCFGLLVKLWPWGTLHLAALPVAVVALASLRRKTGLFPPSAGAFSTPLLAAFYCGWLIQANFLQFQFDYHLVSVLLLGLTLIVADLGLRDRSSWSWAALLILAACAVAAQPAICRSRLSLWGRCLAEGTSPELLDVLAVDAGGPGSTPDYCDLEKVANFLRSKEVQDGELTCYSSTTSPLYVQLGVKPSTRFIIPSVYVRIFAQKREQIREEVRASVARYIVTDMREVGLTQAQAVAERPGHPFALPPDFPPEEANSFPFSEPVVFRAGRYCIHQLQGQPWSGE